MYRKREWDVEVHTERRAEERRETYTRNGTGALYEKTEWKKDRRAEWNKREVHQELKRECV